MPPSRTQSPSGDAVIVRGLEFEAKHGYYAEERLATRRFRLHIELRTSLARSSRSDALEDTVDYFWLCETALSVATGETYHLLERVCGAIAEAIQARYPSATLLLELEKLAPPCPGVPEACAVRLVVPPLATSQA
jgi:dihydroneopterin aldolase